MFPCNQSLSLLEVSSYFKRFLRTTVNIKSVSCATFRDEPVTVEVECTVVGMFGSVF